ncbi:hypothetical protein, partial [Phascolarctobacterium sp.]
ALLHRLFIFGNNAEFRGAAVERSKIKICDVPVFLWFVSFTAKRNEHYKEKSLCAAYFWKKAA